MTDLKSKIRPLLQRHWSWKVKRKLLRWTPRRRHVKGTFIHRLLGEKIFAPELWKPTRDEVAKGIAIGLFVGLMPVAGLQIILALLIGFFLRANLSVAALATFVTNPITFAPVLWFQYKLGHWILSLGPHVDMPSPRSTHVILSHAKPLITGSLATALVAALLGYSITQLMWKEISSLRQKKHPIP